MSSPLEVVLSKFPDATRTGSGWMTKCPAHDDRKPSLSIGEGEDGRVLVKCHAGCTTETIVARLGLAMKDLMPAGAAQPTQEKDRPKIVATYDYRDEGGNLLYQVVRYDPKDFRQRRPEGDKWKWSVKGSRMVPYRLPDLLKHPLEKAVAVVEGEKDVHRLDGIGIFATTNAGGAGKWRSEYNEYFRNRFVVVLPDNDEVGRDHANLVAHNLYGVAAKVVVVELSGLPPKGDVSDWIDEGGTKERLAELVKNAQPWKPEDETNPRPWPAPDSLGEPDLPPFPVEAMPEPLRSWAEAESVATQTPIDLPAMLTIGTVAACIAKRVEVQVRDGWQEPVNLYSLVVLEPGNRKSAVFSDAISPLRNFEQEETERLAPAVREYRSETRILEAKLKRLEDQASKANDPLEQRKLEKEAFGLSHELAERPVVVSPKLIVDDCTPERLQSLLAEHGGRIASMSAEGGVFDLMKGAYSKNGMPMFGVYLMGHAGDDIRVDRVGRPAEYVHKPAITMALAVQPEVLRGLSDQAAFRGRGLTARFIYSIPKSTLGFRDIAPPPVPATVDNAYRGLIDRLCRLESAVDADGRPAPHRLRLSSGASSTLHEFMQAIEPELGPGGEYQEFKDWASKLAGAVVRLSGVLHMVHHAHDSGPWSTPISPATMMAAVRIGVYLVPHADAAYQMMLENGSISEAQYLLHAIKRYCQRNAVAEFSRREMHQATKRRFETPDSLDGPLKLLQEHKYIRFKRTPAPRQAAGRPPSQQYEVNPALLTDDGKLACERSQKPQNPLLAKMLQAGNSFEDFENAHGVLEPESEACEWAA